MLDNNAMIDSNIILLGCNPQAYKASACPASRPKKEPRVSNRDINGLMDKGILHV